MREFMIDLETLDLGPRSVVLSVGLTEFDELGTSGFEPLYYPLALDDQLRAGRTVSQSTLLWWMGQSPEARDKAFADVGRVGVRFALAEIARYLGEDDRAVWANGPSFDCVLMDTLCDDFGWPHLWWHNQVRDMRTIREESGMPRDWSDGETYVDHDPVDDCRRQVAVVLEARRRIASGGRGPRP